MDDSVITCDDTIDAEVKSHDEETKTIPTNFNEKKTTCETQIFYISFALLVIAIKLLIALSIYFYLIKHQAEQKHLLPFHVTNNELKQVIY